MVQYGLILIILFAGIFWSIKAKKLTTPAALLGGLIGFIVFLGVGFSAIAAMTCFFILGTLATSHKIKIKQSLGLSEINKGRRTAGQVFANAGVAAILAGLALIFPPYTTLLELMIAASFSAASADTLSSELGNVYGKKYYNILTFKKDTRGLNGVVSIEGTIIGLAGSIIIAMIYSLFFGWNKDAVLIIIAGTIGNISDSILGASLENKGYLRNNTVNFLNTLVGALVALLLSSIS